MHSEYQTECYSEKYYLIISTTDNSKSYYGISLNKNDNSFKYKITDKPIAVIGSGEWSDIKSIQYINDDIIVDFKNKSDYPNNLFFKNIDPNCGHEITKFFNVHPHDKHNFTIGGDVLK